MLKTMRSSISSLTMKVLLSALILSFISFYGWSAGGGCNSHDAAVVNGDSISYTDVEMRLRSFIAQYKKMGLIRDDVSPEILNMIRTNVVTSMIDQRLKTQAARDLGLVPSEVAVRDMIKSQFTDEKGNFDFETYKLIVTRQLKKTPGSFERDEADALLAQSFERLMTDSAYVTSEQLKQMYAARNQKVNVTYVELDPRAVKKLKPKEPTQNEIDEYFKQHTNNYKMPEKRKLEITWLSLADLSEPKDADLQGVLDAEFPKEDDNMNKGERIRAAHILVKADATNVDEKRKVAEKIYERLLRGEKFETLAQIESEDSSRSQGGDLGYFGKGAMVKEFETAALALHVGQISKPVKSNFGFHIIKLIDRIPAGERTLARLRPELVYRFKQNSIRDPKKEEQLTAEAQKIFAEAKKSGASPDKRVHKLTTGFVSSGDAIAEIPDAAQVIRAAEGVAANAETQPFKGYLSKEFYSVRVLGIQPASVPPLQAVRSRVVEDLQKSAREAAVQEYAKEIIRKATEKKSLEAVAKSEGLKPTETGDFAYAANQRIPKMNVGGESVAKLFALSAEAPVLSEPLQSEGRVFVVALKKKTDPDWAAFDKDRASLLKVAEDEEGRQRSMSVSEGLRAKAKIINNMEKPAPKAPAEPPAEG
jgi:peptidyl-prolyl cis-trans isomerase D